MVIGSHNAWSYLRPKKWWMRLIAPTAKCQHYLIWAQYSMGSRCFDLHIRFNDDKSVEIVHGPIVYDPSSEEEGIDLSDYLEMLDEYKTTSVRLLLDVRTRKAMKNYDFQCECFKDFCKEVQLLYPNIKFWCGHMVKGWHLIYDFDYKPSCDEMYGSVTKPKWFWGICPWLYARTHNATNLKNGTLSDIMLIDFVDVGNKSKLLR